MTALTVGLLPFRIQQPSVKEPPTIDDLNEYGPEACLAVLREEFTGHHSRHAQYAQWTDGTVLGIAMQMIGGHGTFVRAEPGDLLLVKRDRHPWVGCTPNHVAYVPRVGWNVYLGYARIEDVYPKAGAR